MSDDGSVIVGYSDVAGGGGTGFHWDATEGMQSIAGYLTDAGLDVAGWTFSDAEQISADGLSMAGQGHDDTHNTGIWYARCTSVDDCGVISSGNAADSFASLGALGGGAEGALEGDFSELGGALDNAGPGTSASLYGSLDSDPSASAGVVLSFRPSAAVVGALGLGTSRIDTPLAFGGDAAFTATSLSAALGLRPADGLTASLAVSALDLSGTVTRGYLNGNVAAQSTGAASGWAAGLDALLGWRFADAAATTSLWPMASSASVAQAMMAGRRRAGRSPRPSMGSRSTARRSAPGSRRAASLAALPRPDGSRLPASRRPGRRSPAPSSAPSAPRWILPRLRRTGSSSGAASPSPPARSASRAWISLSACQRAAARALPRRRAFTCRCEPHGQAAVRDLYRETVLGSVACGSPNRPFHRAAVKTPDFPVFGGESG